jgi:hypothetical protein
MSKVKTLVAKNPSEARGIRKALKAMGLKFEFKSPSRRPAKKKRNPAKPRRRARSKSKSKAKARRRR